MRPGHPATIKLGSVSHKHTSAKDRLPPGWTAWGFMPPEAIKGDVGLKLDVFMLFTVVLMLRWAQAGGLAGQMLVVGVYVLVRRRFCLLGQCFPLPSCCYQTPLVLQLGHQLPREVTDCRRPVIIVSRLYQQSVHTRTSAHSELGTVNEGSSAAAAGPTFRQQLLHCAGGSVAGHACWWCGIGRVTLLACNDVVQPFSSHGCLHGTAVRFLLHDPHITNFCDKVPVLILQGLSLGAT